ncbi:MAG: SRPBCC family protein [Ignavibacteria bacterium]
MQKFTSSFSIKTDLEKIFKFHLDPKNLKLVSTPNMNLRILEYVAPLQKNSQVKIKFDLLPFIPIEWDLVIENLIDNELIVDLQTKGPFKYWRHQHHFKQLFDGTVVITDEIEYDLGLIGRLIQPLVKWRLNKMFKFRYKIIESLFGG